MERKRHIKYLLLLNLPLVILVGIFILAYATLLKNGEVSLCILKSNLHLYCPGCGGTRALLSLLKFDILESFILYPPLLVLLFLIFEIDFRLLLCVIKNTPLYFSNYKYSRFYILAAVIILNFVLKNALLIFFDIDLIGDIHQAN